MSREWTGERSWSRRSTRHLWPLIVRKVTAGQAPKAVAEEMGLSRETVSRALRAHAGDRTHLRGFGSMDPARHREIARKGGVNAQLAGKSHHFTPAEASLASKKGWQVSPRTREQMREAGSKGGRASAAARKQRRSQ